MSGHHIECPDTATDTGACSRPCHLDDYDEKGTAMTDTDTVVLPDLAALTEADSVKAIRAHLSTHHTSSLSSYLPYGRSVRKDDLLRVHDRFHNDAIFADTRKGEMVGGVQRHWAPNYKPHTHFTVEPVTAIEPKGTAMTDTATPSKAVAKKSSASNGTVATTTGGAPLKSSEKSALMRLLRGDFDALKIDLQNFAQAQAEAARKSVEVEYASKVAKAEKVRGDLVALRRKSEDALRAFITKAREQGVDVEGTSDALRYWPSQVRVAGKDAAIQKAVNEVNRRTTRALNLLERERIGAERAILLASLTEEARTMLDNLPTAEALFSRAVEADTAATS